ncbi:MAG: hypothetical protein AB1454_05240 [Candidatus Auribacterota bacterium]
MKRLKALSLLMLCGLFFASNGLCIVVYNNDFDGTNGTTYAAGEIFGAVDTIKDLSDVPIPVDGGIIMESNGNQLVKLQGVAQNLTADFAVSVDIQEYIINEIAFDFFVSYNPATQANLFSPTTMTVDLYLLQNSQLVKQIYLFNFTFSGMTEDSTDVPSNPESFLEPFDMNYSLGNLAHYTADLTSHEDDIMLYDEAFLVFTLNYWEEGFELPENEPYETTAFVDNITITGSEFAPIPEPASLVLLLIGFAAQRIVNKRRAS